MTESQLKYMNKVKLISFCILVAGLLLVLAWSILKNKVAETPKQDEVKTKTLAINYEQEGTKKKYDYTCATESCILSSQSGLYALVKDGSYKLVNLTKGTNTELRVPSMTKNYMVADEEFYGLVFTKDESNKASFFDYKNEKVLFDQELSYEKMNTESVREVLNKMYPRKLLYTITDESAMIVNLTLGEPALENVSSVFYYKNELYVVNDKGLNLFKEDNTVETTLAEAKEIYDAMYEDSIVILDKDDKIKMSSLKGEIGDTIVEVGANKVESVTATNGVLKIILQDKDYVTNQKLIKYEYTFETKKLNTIE